MKRISIILTAAALVVMGSSCSVLSGLLGGGSAAPADGTAVATPAQTAKVDGQVSGAALKSLYGEYKATGSVDLTNINNILSLMQLKQGIDGLKGMENKSEFYKEFAAGCILGSNNLVNKSNSSNVMTGLSTLANGSLASVTNAAQQAISTTNLTSTITTALAAAQAEAAAQAAKDKAAAEAAAAQAAAAQSATASAATSMESAITSALSTAMNTVAPEATTAVNTLSSIFSLFK